MRQTLIKKRLLTKHPKQGQDCLRQFLDTPFAQSYFQTLQQTLTPSELGKLRLPQNRLLALASDEIDQAYNRLLITSNLVSRAETLLYKRVSPSNTMLKSHRLTFVLKKTVSNGKYFAKTQPDQ